MRTGGLRLGGGVKCTHVVGGISVVVIHEAPTLGAAAGLARHLGLHHGADCGAVGCTQKGEEMDGGRGKGQNSLSVREDLWRGVAFCTPFQYEACAFPLPEEDATSKGPGWNGGGVCTGRGGVLDGVAGAGGTGWEGRAEATFFGGSARALFGNSARVQFTKKGEQKGMRETSWFSFFHKKRIATTKKGTRKNRRERRVTRGARLA